MNYLNAELIHKSEHVHQLHTMELALFVQNEYWQTLTVDNEKERLRLPVAFLDVLFRKQRIKKMLYLVLSSSVKTTVQESIKRHTTLNCYDIEQYDIKQHDVANVESNQEICLSSLYEFGDKLIHAEQVRAFLAQFDLVIVEHSDLKIYELIRYRLQYIYRKAVMEIVYQPKQLIL